MASAVADVVDAERIKEIRGRYGLSQRSFAKVLGIGEASMVRYEKGIEPSKANANLIRAAENPRFVLGCLERDGEDIPAKQRKQAESYIYEWIDLNEKPEDVTPGIDAKEPPMDRMSRIYEITLQQEVLTERAANIVAEIIRVQLDDENQGGSGRKYEGLLGQLSRLKPAIVDEENSNAKALDRISGYLDCAEDILARESLRAAS